MILRYDQGMNTPNETLSPNHPALEAAAMTMYADQAELEGWSDIWESEDERVRSNWRAHALEVLTAALPHLTADDLRNTPAGRALMAEGWEKGVLSDAEPILESDGSMVIGLTLPNPYCQGGADDTAPPECECPEVPERLWTTHYGAVDPGSMIEHNPECPVHRIDPKDSRLPDSWARALNNPDTTKGA